jgi:hypothetical protein
MARFNTLVFHLYSKGGLNNSGAFFAVKPQKTGLFRGSAAAPARRCAPVSRLRRAPSYPLRGSLFGAFFLKKIRMFNTAGVLGGFLFFAVLAQPVSPATVSFLVLETGPGGETSAARVSSAVYESSILWETCLLDVFFEAGHVVSNSPSLHFAGKSAADFPDRENPGREFPREIRPELEEAILGGVDYFVLALLSYSPLAADAKAKPEEVNLRIYSFKSAGAAGGWGFAYGAAAPLGSPAGGSRAQAPSRAEPEREQAKRLIRGLIPHIKD